MIRINLLAVERERTKRRATFQLAEKVTIACSLILVATVVFLVWWWWTLGRAAADLDRDIATARAETTRLNVVIQKMQKAEQHRTQLEQRVALIEDLRKSQTAPVHLLDQISRTLPDGMWLVSMSQKGPDVTIEGRCLVLTAVAELVNSLQGCGYFKAVDLSSTDSERNEQLAADIVKFTIKAQYAPPGIPLTPSTSQASAPGAKPGAK